MIIKSILEGYYYVFLASLITAALGMYLYLSCRKRRLSAIIRHIIGSIKYDEGYRTVCVFAVYLSFVMFRTVTLRALKWDGFTEFIGIWGLYTKTGEIYIEGIENILLFIPLMPICYSYICRYRKISLKAKHLLLSVLIPFVMSLCIEIAQLVMHIGAFQVTDLVYNTLGGVIGGVSAFAYFQMKK